MDANAPLYLGLLKRTPLGNLWVAVSGKGLVAIEWDDHKPNLDMYLTKKIKRPVSLNPEKTAAAMRQLGAAGALLDDFHKSYRGAGRRVFLLTVVGLDDFDIVARAEQGGRLGDELAQGADPDREVVPGRRNRVSRG